MQSENKGSKGLVNPCKKCTAYIQCEGLPGNDAETGENGQRR